MCLVQDIQFPAKFKIIDFQKYTRSSCPKGHLTMYYRKMAAYMGNEKLLIHYFQETFSDFALNWYMQLDGRKIQTWKYGPYYDKMIGNTSTLFSDIITIGERVEQGLKSGKIGKVLTSCDPRKTYKKKREEGVHAVIFAPKSQVAPQVKPRDDKVVEKILTTYAKLLPQLLEASMLVRLPPTKMMYPPYPPWYKPEERWDYHSDSSGHSVERCKSYNFVCKDL
uniref:Retrotransposon gag domain-containing protein n=1 Tax=Cajanus cajan TaxID=3821 RepID=A0A151QN71_CAJCA|nr:hypothetical protein KK1_047790 [Cajanus cajan]KYP34730.1 hypothetical protein KK1_044292 [Cajanus cajan]